MSILSGDFDFIFKLENLSSLIFEDFPLSLNFMARALKELKSIDSVRISQRGNFNFVLMRTRSQELFIDLYLPHSGNLDYRILVEEAPELMNTLKSLLNADGAVCPEAIQVLLRQLGIEKQNALFMMRKYVYDQRHSICLSEEQMRLLNLLH